MPRVRMIPCLLLRGRGLVKTKKFKDSVYIGDPLNVMRIFSDKEADEIFLLDIDASRQQRNPNVDLVQEVAGEAFMPLAYGGGVRSLDQVRRLIRAGIEKVVINTAATESLDLIRDVSAVYGSQAVVGAVDVKKSWTGHYRVVAKSATMATNLNLKKHVQDLVEAGAGEILVTSVDRDGTMEGYDLDLIQSVSGSVNVPVVACGGAGSFEHLRDAVRIGGASAVAAGSLFVFHGKHRAVLINYPKGKSLV